MHSLFAIEQLFQRGGCQLDVPLHGDRLAVELGAQVHQLQSRAAFEQFVQRFAGFVVALAAVGHWWDPQSVGWLTVANAIEVSLNIVFLTVIFAMIYKVMPRAHVAWRDVGTGALFTATLFTLGKSLIGLYVGTSAVTSGFGAAGSLVVVLLWVYWSAQIFLLGAEFTWVYANQFGSRRPRTTVPAGPVPAV